MSVKNSQFLTLDEALRETVIEILAIKGLNLVKLNNFQQIDQLLREIDYLQEP